MVNYVFCLAHFCEIHGPSTIICTQRYNEAAPPTSKLLACASCELQLPEEASNLITSADGKNGADKFLSTRYPTSQKVYTSLMKLVMKSLSVETTADPLKPVFFGDLMTGFCLSKIFSLKDVQARGGERKYSLMMVCDLETRLLQNWDIFSGYANAIIGMLQKQVQANLEETSKNGVVNNERYLRRSKVNPRSLVELTDDNQIFVKFHLWAMEVLQDVG